MKNQFGEDKKFFLRNYKLKEEIKKLELPENIKEQLTLSDIRIILPKKDAAKKNNRFNVFVSGATEISGEQRICYMEIEETDIILTEFKGARGDRYSGFYKILIALLDGRIDYTNETNKIILKLQDLERLLNVFNEISNIYRNKNCIVRTESETFCKKIGGKVYEYPIKYYEIAENKMSKDLDTTYKIWKDIRGKIEGQCETLIEGTGDQFVSTYKEIQQLQKYLEKILNENMDRKTALEKKRGIQI